MSTISVSNIETANGSEPLTLSTGNTSAGDIVINPDVGIVLASNSSINSIILSTGSVANVLVSNSSGTYIANSKLIITSNSVSIENVLVSNSSGTYILNSNFVTTGKAIAMAIVFG